MATTDDIELTIERLKMLKSVLMETYDNMVRERDKLKSDLKDCRNELCLRCGEYKTAHLGSCDGCRWKDVG